MAEGIFKQLIAQEGLPGLQCASAGISALEGQPASENAVVACREIGVDLSGHRSHRITAEDLIEADLIATVSPTHAYILQKAGAPEEKLLVLGELLDPYGEDLSVYRQCRDTLLQALKKLLERVRAR